MRLANKTAVITGAAGDIGKAVARRFAEEGARLALIDRDYAGLVEVSALLPTAATIKADVTNESDLQQAAEAVRSQFGTIDVLLVNAGIEQSYVAITEMEKEAFERVVSVNLTGAFLTAKHFLPIVADNGSVMFTSSIAALRAYPGYSAYSEIGRASCRERV